MHLVQHEDGSCGDKEQVVKKELERYGNGAYALEITYSNGDHNKNYDQTYAAGPPGYYIHFSPGSDKIWHGHATDMYYHSTDVTFEEFLETARSLTVKMNDEAGYDAVRNNCQDFSLRFLDALGATDLRNKAAAHAFVENPAWKAKGIVLCDTGGLFTGLCWPLQGQGSDRRRRRHVGMPDNCHQTYDTPALKPTFYGGVYTCGAR